MDESREKKRLKSSMLLQMITRRERKSNKGHLKIFLGMSAGVGKTYAMLEQAQFLKRANIDVVIGHIESHGRGDLEDLLENLPQIPLQKILYKEKLLEELDLDAILKLHPELVLIDELAHTNIPGSRHLKRWEDIIEILENDIDVWTTLNIQHIESLKEHIEAITGLQTGETIPDFLFYPPTSVHIIDLTPEELIHRLKEGKIYLRSQSQIATDNFFKKDRLTALREMTLRYVAEMMTTSLKEMSPDFTCSPSAKEANSHEKLLVAISHDVDAQQLLRYARRIAYNLDIPWIALHVDSHQELSQAENDQLQMNLSLARELGAEVMISYNPDIASAIARIAKQHQVSAILIGRPKRKFFAPQRFALFERLSNLCKNINILLSKEEDDPVIQSAFSPEPAEPVELKPYCIAASLTLLLAGFSWLLLSFVGYKIIGMIFLLGILAGGLYFKKGPLLFGSVIAVFLWNFFFIPTDKIFEPRGPEDMFFMATLLFTATIVGILVDRSQIHKEKLQRREISLQSLYEIFHHVFSSSNLDDALGAIDESLSTALKGRCKIILHEKHHESFEKCSDLLEDQKEQVAARWALENSKEAGLSTSTLPLCKNLYIPLARQEGIPLGVIVYRPAEKRGINSEDKKFLYTACPQISLYIAHQYELRKAA